MKMMKMMNMNMKKILALLIVYVLVLGLTACSNSSVSGASSGGSNESDGASGEEIALDSFKTIEDALNIESESTQWSGGENTFVYVFEKDGKYYRLIANMTDEQSEALSNIDFSDDNYEEKQNEIIGPLEVVKAELLNDLILTQEEMDAWVGKTGKELLDDGWTTGMGYNLDTMEFWMGYGSFYYTVVFDGNGEELDIDTFDEEEGIKDFKVQSIEFLSLGDATNIEA